MNEIKLTHINRENRPEMVDVSDKPLSHRIAKAYGKILLDRNTCMLISDNKIKKGNVLITAELAGTMGGKKTSELIPLCHPLNITKLTVKASLMDDCVEVFSEAVCNGQTGVEMEALTAVSIALLTVYDMCKAVDKNMVISEIKLLEKTKTLV